MANTPENNNVREDWDDEWEYEEDYEDGEYDEEEYEDEEELDEEEKKLMDRREFNRKVGVGLFLLISGILGTREACIKCDERAEVRRLADELESKVDKKNRKLYFHDDVTDNYLQRYKMKNGKVRLNEHGKPINSSAWEIVQKMPEDARELVHVRDCHGKRMYDIYGRPVRLAKFLAEKLKKADRMLWDAEKEHIKLTTSFRENVFQQRLYKSRVIDRKKAGKRPWITALTGSSRHELGFAIDVANWVDAERYLVRADFVGGMYSSNARMRYGDACHFTADLKDFKGLRKYNELVRDIKLAKEEAEGDDWTDWLANKWDKTSEWTQVKTRYVRFLIEAKGTEAYHFGAGKIKKLLD